MLSSHGRAPRGGVAFQELPPLEEFVAARLTREFVARSAFESNADDLAVAFLQQRGMSPESLVQARDRHFKATEVGEGRDASEAELVDLHGVFSAQGVAPVSRSPRCIPMNELARRTRADSKVDQGGYGDQRG